MQGTVMFESGLVEVEVCQVEGGNAMVRDREGEAYWIALSDLEQSEPGWS